MTNCYLLPGTWKRLFVYAIHVDAYWGEFRTLERSKMEHFVTKKITKHPPPPPKKKKKKTVEKYAKKKMNIAAGKYPQTNTVRICMKVFFLSK